MRRNIYENDIISNLMTGVWKKKVYYWSDNYEWRECMIKYYWNERPKYEAIIWRDEEDNIW